jgi:hypothetical protein
MLLYFCSVMFKLCQNLKECLLRYGGIFRGIFTYLQKYPLVSFVSDHCLLSHRFEANASAGYSGVFRSLVCSKAFTLDQNLFFLEFMVL